MENKLDINIFINNSKNPNDHHDIYLKTWDDIFEFQRRLDGANYSLLVEWLKKYYNSPQIKTWDDIFEYQSMKDGANYSLLVSWLKKNCSVSQIKK